MIRAKVKYWMEQKVNIHRLKTKMILQLFLLFVLFITIMIFDNILVSKIIKEEVYKSSISSVKETKKHLSFLFDRAWEISMNLSADLTINEDMTSLFNDVDNLNNSPYKKFRLTDELISKIVNFSQLNEYIDSIYLYSDALDMVMTANYGIYSYDDVPQFNGLNIANEVNSAYEWRGQFYDNCISSKNYLSLITRADIINRELHSRVCISMNFDEKKIYEILSNLKLTQNTEVYLVDKENCILAAESKEVIGLYIEEVLNTKFEDIQNSSLSRIKRKYKGYYQKIYESNNTTKWNILVLIPEKELLEKQRKFIQLNVFILLGIFAIFMYLASIIIVHHVDKPMIKLVEFMKQAQKGNFNVRIDENRLDEFGYLYRSYNEMIQKIKNLIKELYEEKLLKKDAELKMLQKQINPHFLYNILDSISWVAKENNVKDISDIINALSNHYRLVFNKGRECIEVSKMIENLKNYLYIFRFQYGDQFMYEFDIEEEANNYQVLNLILQPLIENAILHGIKNGDGKAIIKVKSKMEDNLLNFYIEDNGKGMSEEKLKLVEANIRRKATSGDSGLKNVYHRIKLFYGEKYGLSIKSSQGYGTCVKVTVPVFEKIYEG